jgi:hypothetical protein
VIVWLARESKWGRMNCGILVASVLRVGLIESLKTVPGRLIDDRVLV